MNLTHEFPIRVYYEDTDHGGVVYHSNYLKFMERARTEMLRAQGIELDKFEQQHGVIFAVTHADVRFIKPARFNDQLEVYSTITRMSGTRIWFEQRILHMPSSTLLIEAEITVASINREGKAKRIPDTLRQQALMIGIKK